MNKLFLTLFCACLTIIAPVWAKQNAFQSKHRNGQVILAYTWQDPSQKQHSIQFNLPQDAAQLGNSEFVKFSNKTANDVAYKDVKTYIQQQNIKGLKVKRTRSGYAIEFEGAPFNVPRVKQIMSEVKDLRDKSFQNYVKKSFYTNLDDNTLIPDHKRIAKRYINAMRPVAEALAQNMHNMTERQRINYLMHFLQSIPYDTLTSRYNSNGAGFQTPYGLLINNKGDCDTKAVALMALLRNFYPQMRMVMVYVKDHAFIAIDLPAKQGEKALNIGGGHFVIADPTGPAQVKLGQPDRRALTALKRGAYSYQELEF